MQALFSPFSQVFSGFFRFFRLSQSSRVFFHHFPLRHHLMTAAFAFQPEISAYPENFPFLTPARMGLLQFNNISDLIIPLFFHCFLPFVAYDSRPGSSPRISSILLSSCSVNSRWFSAATLSSSWPALLAPTRTLVTSGRRKTQASAICARV